MDLIIRKLKSLYKYLAYRPEVIVIYRICIVLAVFTLSRFLFYLFNLKFFPETKMNGLFDIFLGGFRFDLAAVIYFNFFWIFLILFPHRLHQNRIFIKSTDFLFYSTNAVSILLNTADIAYYTFTNKRTAFDIFEEFRNENNFGSLLYHFLLDYSYIFLIWLILVFFLYFLTKKIKISGPVFSGVRYYLSRFVILVLFMTLAIIGARGGLPPKQDFPLYPSDAGQYTSHPAEVSIVLNTPFNMIMTMDKKRFPEVSYFSSDSVMNTIYSPVHEPDTTIAGKKLNVVIIMVESFGRELIGFFNQKLDQGKYKGYTPFLDSLCHHSYVFMNSFANSRISIEGTPAIAASIPSFETSYTLSLYSDNKIMSLASCLRDMGYRTFYFHGAPNGSLGLNSFAKLAGFDKYYGKDEYNNDKDYDGTWGIWDHKFLPYAAKVLDDGDARFLAYIFTVSSHHPFAIPGEFTNKFDKGTEKMYRSISYTDYSIKLFFDYASKKPWFRNTLFIITGDHSYTTLHHDEYKSYFGYMSVPIIFYEPGLNLGRLDSCVAEQIDIMPTVLNYLGYKKSYFAFGRDLFSNAGPQFAISYIGGSYQILLNNWVLRFDEKKSTGLFDNKKDIANEVNLIGKSDSVQIRMEKYAHAFLQQYFTRLRQNRMVIY